MNSTLVLSHEKDERNVVGKRIMLPPPSTRLNLK
jgi:hypothetical protein